MAGNAKTWLQNSSFSPALIEIQHKQAATQALDKRAGLLAQAETSEESDPSEATKKRKRGKPETEKATRHQRKLTVEDDRREVKQSSTAQHSTTTVYLSIATLKSICRRKEKAERKLASLDARARAAGPLLQAQLHFSWLEEVERLGTGISNSIDRHQETNNLVYEKPYLMNIPAYRRILPRWSRVQALWDDSLQTDPRRKRRRRFTTKRAKLMETNKEVPRLRFSKEESGRQESSRKSGMSLPQPLFISLTDEEGGNAEGQQAKDLSEADWLRRQTMQFNKATTDNPENLHTWLAFAAFQEDYFGIEGAPQARQARLQRDAAEKKVDILQKALRHHPGSDEVLLQLLQASTVFQEHADTHRRWQAVLRDPSLRKGWRLWQAYINWLKEDLGQVSTTMSVLDVREAYNQAMKAVAKNRLQLLGNQALEEMQEAEAALLDLLAGICQFDMQSGYTELCVGRIQAALEFTLLTPAWSIAVPGPGGDSVRKHLFEHFWTSGSPLIGEEGGDGWQQWAAQQHQQGQPALPPEEPDEEEDPGGWTGWQELEIDRELVSEQAIDLLESEMDEDAIEADDPEEAQQRELEALLEAEAAQLQPDGAITPEIAKEWLRWERYRERCNWQPVRPKQDEAEEDKEDSLMHLVSFSDIEPALFSLALPANKRNIVLRLLGLLDAPFGLWNGTNSTTFLLDWNNTASLHPQLAHILLQSSCQSPLGKASNAPPDPAFAWLSPDWVSAGLSFPMYAENGTVPWYQADSSRQSFLVATLGTLLKHTQLIGDTTVCEALVMCAAAPVLHSVNPAADGEHDSDLPLQVVDDAMRPAADVRVARHDSVMAVQTAVTELLKQHSLGSPLWTAYASWEAVHGSIQKARKTFNLHLLNASKHAATTLDTASLALAFASAEVKRKAENYQAIAMHVLCWLAWGHGSFEPFDPAAVQMPHQREIAKARQGFQTHISHLIPSAKISLDEDQGAVLLAAALFERLANSDRGTVSAAQLLRNAIAEFRQQIRKDDVIVEMLTLEMCQLLCLATQTRETSPRDAYTALHEALQVYPQSVVLMQMMANVHQRAFMMSQLRLQLKMACKENDCAPMWLLAAHLEAVQLLTQYRMKQLFRNAEHHEQLSRSPLWRRVELAYHATAGSAGLDVVFSHTSGRCSWSKEMWLDGIVHLRNPKLRLAEAERRDIQLRTAVEEVVLTVAGKRVGL